MVQSLKKKVVSSAYNQIALVLFIKINHDTLCSKKVLCTYLLTVLKQCILKSQDLKKLFFTASLKFLSETIFLIFPLSSLTR